MNKELEMKDRLTCSLIGLARAANGNEAAESTGRILVEGMAATRMGIEIDEDEFERIFDEIHREKSRMIPGCMACQARCGKNDDYDMNDLWQEEDEEIRALKILIFDGVREVAGLAVPVIKYPEQRDEIYEFFYRTLFLAGLNWDKEQLVPIAVRIGEMALKCRKWLAKSEN